MAIFYKYYSSPIISSACHVSDLKKWVEKDLDIFSQYVKSLGISTEIAKEAKNFYVLGLISYNAIDSIADAESDPRDLNFFLSILLEYKIIFDKLSKKSMKLEFLKKLVTL